ARAVVAGRRPQEVDVRVGRVGAVPAAEDLAVGVELEDVVVAVRALVVLEADRGRARATLGDVRDRHLDVVELLRGRVVGPRAAGRADALVRGRGRDLVLLGDLVAGDRLVPHLVVRRAVLDEGQLRD